MNVLDENILEGQRQLLEAWRIPVRQIGHDWARKGLKDEDIVVALRRLRRPTFFTRDAGFYRRELCHTGYCLVIVSANQYEVASFVRPLLRHLAFRTQSQRMGRVVRVAPTGVTSWAMRGEIEAVDRWQDRNPTQTLQPS